MERSIEEDFEFINAEDGDEKAAEDSIEASEAVEATDEADKEPQWHLLITFAISIAVAAIVIRVDHFYEPLKKLAKEEFMFRMVLIIGIVSVIKVIERYYDESWEDEKAVTMSFFSVFPLIGVDSRTSTSISPSSSWPR